MEHHLRVRIILRTFFRPTGNELERHKSDNSVLTFQPCIHAALWNVLDQSNSSLSDRRVRARGPIAKFTMGRRITGSEGVSVRQAGMGDSWGLLPPLGLQGQRQDEVSSGLKSQAARRQAGWWRLPGWGGNGEGGTSLA